MLHTKLRNKIEAPNIRFLYDLKIYAGGDEIDKRVEKVVKEIRAKVNKKDPMMRKIKKFKAKDKETKKEKEFSRTVMEWDHKKSSDPYLAKLAIFGNKGDWAKVKSAELDKVVYDESKTVPPNSEEFGLWRSIEFEVIFKNQEALETFAKLCRGHGISKFVTIKNDGSLRAADEDQYAVPKEVVVSYKAGNEKWVEWVCEDLRTRAYVNNTCGTHVHFDRRHMDEKAVEKCGHRLARAVPALKLILPKSRRNNKNCEQKINDIKGGTAESRVRQTGNHHSYDTARYAFVNLQAYARHKTLEIRGHSGTMNAEKILNWIALCEKIMTQRIRFKLEAEAVGGELGEIVNPLDLIKVYKLDEKLSAYVAERYKKFNTVRDIPTHTSIPPVPIPPAPGLVMPLAAPQWVLPITNG